MSRPAARSSFEQLESRLLMSSVHHKIGGKHYELEILDNLPTLNADANTGAAAAAGPSLAAAVPAFSSLPGAADTIFLDFDGHFEAVWGAYSNVTTPEFNLDGVAGFNAAELTAIQDIWKVVAEDYAPFNINVTTVQPASFSNGVSLRVSIGAGSWFGAAGGVGYIDSYTNSIVNTVYVFPQYLANWAKYIGDASSHEAGHAFGLQHQSQYSGTKKIADYYAGPGDGRAPIMGNSYDATRGLWWNGTSTSSTAIQDDMTMISRSTNTFGYRADDFGDSSAAAFTLVPSGSSVGSAGVITKTSDRDYFRIDSAAGNVAFSVSVPQHNNLDARLELWTSDGLTLLASSDPSGFSASINYTVAGGSYLVVVASHGSYGDVGTYTLNGTVVPGSTSSVAAPTSFSAAAIGTNVNLGWNDNANNETAYIVQRSTSSSFATFTTFNLAANATTMTDTGLAADTTYYYRVQATDGSSPSAFASASTVTIPAVVTASASAASSTQVNLSWTNPGAETSFRVERSTNQVDWTTIANPAANVTSLSDTGRTAGTTYYYRVFALNAAGSTAASNTATATTPAAPTVPAAPTALTWTSATRSTVSLRWNDNATNETNYIVQRSTNGGGSWSTIATLGVNVTTYTATGLSRQRTYTFRVYARNAVGNSAYTNTLNVTTPRSGTITPASTAMAVEQVGKKVKLLA